jgi:hypothetical protein
VERTYDVNCAMMLGARAMLVFALASPAVVAGQAPSDGGVRPEVRLDAVHLGNREALQGGAGVQIPLGYYTRVGIVGAAGVSGRASKSRASGRLDVLARFVFDPFRQTRWGFSAGAGVSLSVREGDRVRPHLATVLDLEGPRSSRGIAPAIQIGLGGGVRVGAGLRWGAEKAR